MHPFSLVSLSKEFEGVTNVSGGPKVYVNTCSATYPRVHRRNVENFDRRVDFPRKDPPCLITSTRPSLLRTDNSI